MFIKIKSYSQSYSRPCSGCPMASARGHLASRWHHHRIRVGVASSQSQRSSRRRGLVGRTRAELDHRLVGGVVGGLDSLNGHDVRDGPDGLDGLDGLAGQAGPLDAVTIFIDGDFWCLMN